MPVMLSRENEISTLEPKDPSGKWSSQREFTGSTGAKGSGEDDDGSAGDGDDDGVSAVTIGSFSALGPASALPGLDVGKAKPRSSGGKALRPKPAPRNGPRPWSLLAIDDISSPIALCSDIGGGASIGNHDIVYSAAPRESQGVGTAAKAASIRVRLKATTLTTIGDGRPEA